MKALFILSVLIMPMAAEARPSSKKEAQQHFAGLFSCGMGYRWALKVYKGQEFPLKDAKAEKKENTKALQGCGAYLKPEAKRLWQAGNIRKAITLGCEAGLRASLMAQYGKEQAKERAKEQTDTKIRRGPAVADLVVSSCATDARKLFARPGFDQTSYEQLLEMIGRFNGPLP